MAKSAQTVNMKSPIKPIAHNQQRGARFQAAPGLDANALELFARVVQAGSFAQAARQLGLTRAAVSRRIAAIEAQAGHVLLARTTRSLGLTEPGRRLAQRARAVLEASEAARGALRASHAGLAGRLRITAVPSFGRTVLVPLLADFRRLNPSVSFELLFTDRRVDLLREGVDVAFRITHEPPQDWVALPLMPLRVSAYAAPSMASALGSPAELSELPLLVLGAAREAADLTWQRLSGDGPPCSHSVGPNVAAFSVDMESLTALARHGLGVLLAPSYCVGEACRTGALIDLLPGWHLPVPEGDAVLALTLAHPQVSEAARALVRHCADALQAEHLKA
jgi:DNA-binding transcriptional LysR family regulator